MTKLKILIVDDENEIRDYLKRFLLKKIECIVEDAADALAALEKLKNTSFDLALVDIKMPGLSGIDLIKKAIKFTPATKFLVMSGYDSYEVAHTALEIGAADFISKPQTPQAVLAKIKDVLKIV